MWPFSVTAAICAALSLLLFVRFAFAGKYAKALLWGASTAILVSLGVAAFPWITPTATPYGRQMARAPLSPQAMERIDSFLREEAESVDAFVMANAEALRFEWGDSSFPTNMHSARKSALSLLIGIAVDKGLLRTDATLAELNIDEPKAPLTERERTATVRDLLMSRSGVYIPSGAETRESRALRPERGAHDPGEHYYYNNWDFNALGYIFEQETGMSIGEALRDWLAEPMGMQDFHPSHVLYGDADSTSQYPAYHLLMSARDLARLGCLLLSNGTWSGRSIVTALWLEESTAALSQTGDRFQYGYMWWVDPQERLVGAGGWGGQFLIVDFKSETVAVSRTFTGNSYLGRLRFSLMKRPGDPYDALKALEMATAQQSD